MSELYLMYLRKSRADGENETVEEVLAKHERMLQKLAVEKFGHPISEKYIYREVVSGETIADRPEMQKVFSAIEFPEVKGVLVVDPQRLSRGDWEDGGKILSGFKYTNTLIITPPKTYDLHNQFDYKFFKMELSRGNDYLEYTKEILRRGRENAIEAGHYLGSIAPYGHEKAYIDKAPTLKPVPHEAEAINIAIRKRVFDGMGWTFIGMDLEQMGYMPRNAEHWNPYTLRDICMNPVNIGKVKWNTRKTIKTIEDGKIVKKRPRNKENPIYVDGLHDPIVDKDLFEMLLAIDTPVTKETVENPLTNPLAGLLYCGVCGHAMTYRTYRKNGVERCRPRVLCYNQTHCGTKSAYAEDVVNLLIESLENIIASFEFKLQNDDTPNIYLIQQSKIHETEIALSKLNEKENDIYNYLEEKIYTKDVFLKRMEKLQADREKLQAHLDYLRENTVEPINYKEKIIAFRDVVDALTDDSISAKHKNNLLHKIIKRIDYYRVDKSPEDGPNLNEYICFYRKRGDSDAELKTTTALLPSGTPRCDVRKHFVDKIGFNYKVVRVVSNSKRKATNDTTKAMIKVHLRDL